MYNNNRFIKTNSKHKKQIFVWYLVNNVLHTYLLFARRDSNKQVTLRIAPCVVLLLFFLLLLRSRRILGNFKDDHFLQIIKYRSTQ